MKLVLLSGGSGKRLWPLSNDSRSKQFLKVLENEDKEMVSMVQRVWGQIESSGLGESTYVATGKSQIEMMNSQLGPQVPLIIEPERRDTFPAIALAATYLYSSIGADPDGVVAILPVDPYVETRFFETIKKLEQVVALSGSELALIGVQPTYPSSKYGYIIPDTQEAAAGGYRRVDHFREKPPEEEANELIAQGAMWNCGVFAFRLGYLISILIEKGLPIQYEELSNQYHQLPRISFDYEVVEKAQELAVVSYEGYWKDLGTWNTLTEEMKNQQIGKGMISGDCRNTHLVNELDIPVSIIGLSDIVVAASPDGILVTDKRESPRIKDYIDYNQGPMYEERQWGWVKILDDQSYEDGSCAVTKRVCIFGGKCLSYRMHTSREEVWTIVKGEAEFVQNGNFMRIGAGNILHIPMKTLHTLRALSDLEMIVVQSGREQEANRILELYQTWDEMVQHCFKTS